MNVISILEFLAQNEGFALRYAAYLFLDDRPQAPRDLPAERLPTRSQLIILGEGGCDVVVAASALCRSRRELSNTYLLAKFGFDTPENEPCKV